MDNTTASTTGTIGSFTYCQTCMTYHQNGGAHSHWPVTTPARDYAVELSRIAVALEDIAKSLRELE